MGKQHLYFTVEIWTNDTDLTLSAKKDKVEIVTNSEFPFLDIKMNWFPEGDLYFSVFRKK